jgi:topoisomerase-4 subunit A
MATSIPPHNAAELCDAALKLIDKPGAKTRELLKYVKGPDFPTGGIVVQDGSLVEAYSTGRGSFRVRARWSKEDTGHGTWLAVVTEIPYLVPKSRLIEKMAELLNDKKLPLLADVRDESAEEVRIVLEPKSRNVDPHILMESLFKLTELETRFSLNLNVLTRGQVPRVVSLAEALKEWLDYRRDVLVRRAKHRLAEIEHRLEVLDGWLIAYLNLDAVIKIIRKEDEPKPVLMKRFKLSEVQADAILNMRLRNLRRLEEMEIKREHKELTQERTDIKKLIASPAQQWKKIGDEVRLVREKFGPKTALGKRRTGFSEAPVHDEEAFQEAMTVREPITVVVSEKGWIRALRGHQEDLSSLTFKEADQLKLAFKSETTAKLTVFASNGRFYTIDAAKLPGGRGHGEPIRLFIDMEQAEPIDVFNFVGGRKFLVASAAGRGFVVKEDECLATTRKGKQVLNVKPPDAARAMAVVEGDTVAAIGENRKMLLFPLEQLPEMTRGSGVRIQRYKDGGLSDVKVFDLDKGLTVIDSAERKFEFSEKDLRDWRGNRADAGRLAPRGFPRSNRFG